MKITVFIQPKPNVSDPEATVIQQALHRLGLTKISEVRRGKTICFQLPDTDVTEVKAQVELACEKLLANPVIEDYHYTFSQGHS